MFSDLAQTQAGQRIEIAGPEAHHTARVKRVRPGERIGMLDGIGCAGSGILHSVGGSKSSPVLLIDLESHEMQAPITPHIEVYAALPKGDRLDRMIDQLAQYGVRVFRPLICDRSQRKADSARPDKLGRIADEAIKQCRRAWGMQIGEPIAFKDAVGDPDAIIADASGPCWDAQRDAAPRSVLLIGPEGGWSPKERDLFGATGLPVRRFGLFVLRIEAAASAASAIVLGASIHTD
jgi:16S rRNA (uracil1498-N3)-methyltransferase